MADRSPGTPASPPAAAPSPKVHLVPLATGELADYLDTIIPEYALDHVRDGQWTPEEAPGRARQEVESLLPRGLETPDQYLRTIVAVPEGLPVGRLWFAVRRSTGPAFVFIYDLVVFEEHRGHGFGEAAIRALEPIARGLGASRISLHVFGNNTTAIRLYERVGYRTTNLLMSKPLGGTDTSGAR